VSAPRAVAAACALAGPTVLAFFAGGYYSEPRLVAGLVAWSCVLLLTLTGCVPLPRTGAGWAVLGGLVLMTVWSAISIAWAPLKGPAVENVQRLTLYVGALVLAIGVLRLPRALRALEPALAAGATVVIGYGLAGRLLPGLVRQAHSRSAGGRLEQPLTYWNAEGALAVVGLLLCARIAGDTTRPAIARALAAAAVAPLAAGVYLSYSRGALVVALLGLSVLVAAAPTREQLRAAVAALLTGVLAAAACGAFRGVASLAGSAAVREREGAIALALLLVVMAAAGTVTALRARAGGDSPDAALARSRRLGTVVGAAVAIVAAGLVVGGLAERPSRADLALTAQPRRLARVSSNRYEYWRVGLKTFAHQPLKGAGSAGFRVAWLRERAISETVRDVHSLEVEMAAELGVVGLLALALMTGGAVAAGRGALRDSPAAAGAVAATLAWFLHASIDWDWELPAASLPAVVLTGALIVLAEPPPARRRDPDGAGPPPPAPPRGDHGPASS
jgi:hypothetical protein